MATTLAAIRAAAADRADQPTPTTTTFVPTATWNQYINASYQELYGLLVQSFGDDYFVQTPFSITTDGTNYLYALPSDFFKLLGVDLKMGSRWVTLRSFTFSERNRHAIVSNVPTAGLVLQAWYIPRVTSLVADGDAVVDAVDVNGWSEFIVEDVARKALQKEESDVGVSLSMNARLKERIEEEAARRDAGQPATVADMSNANGYFPARFYGPTGLRYRLAGSNLWLNPDDSLLWAGGSGWS